MKKDFGTLFVSSVLAGFCIGIGATAYLLCENRLVGCVSFSVGLLMIRTFGLSLYTGLVGYAPYRGKEALREIPVVWCGNVIGAFLVAFLERFTVLWEKIHPKAEMLLNGKLEGNTGNLLLLAALCNVMIVFATYKQDHLCTVFGVSVFVLCGFEHSIADAYYIATAGALFRPKAWLLLLAVTAGNAIGGILFCGMLSLGQKRTKTERCCSERESILEKEAMQK